MLRHVMAPDGVLFAIDPFPGGRAGLSYQRPIAHGEVRRVRNGTVVWLRTTGALAASDPRVAAAPFDFIFIDSDHTFDGSCRPTGRRGRRTRRDIIALARRHRRP